MTLDWEVKAAELWVTIKSLILTIPGGASGEGAAGAKE